MGGKSEEFLTTSIIFFFLPPIFFPIKSIQKKLDVN